MKVYGSLSNHFKHNGIDHWQLWFIPDQNIGCTPPFAVGKMDTVWVTGKVNVKSKEEVEKQLV